MRPHTLLTTLLLTSLIACTGAQSADTQPGTTQPASTQPASTQPADTQPADTQPATQPASTPAHNRLERIEQRAKKIETLQADVRYERVQGLLGDRQIRRGKLHYDAGPPKRFAIHFDEYIVNNRLKRRDRWYIFDGRWLVERDHEQRVFVKRELVPEGEQREQMLNLDNGPFLLPLDLEKEKVLQRFNVTLIDNAQPGNQDEDEDIPENAFHLRFLPRENVDVDVLQLDMWYDRDTLLPVKVRGEEKGKEHWIVQLSEITTGPEIDETVFNTTRPESNDWQIEIKRIPQQ